MIPIPAGTLSVVWAMGDETGSGGGGGDTGWSAKTITGAIAAIGTFLAAVAALINSTSGFRSAPAADAAPAALSSTQHMPVPANPAQREFRVGMMSDGFAWVRADRSASSEGKVKLPSGTHVVCGNMVADADPASPRKWRFCAEHDGYVSARLLVPLAP